MSRVTFDPSRDLPDLSGRVYLDGEGVVEINGLFGTSRPRSAVQRLSMHACQRASHARKPRIPTHSRSEWTSSLKRLLSHLRLDKRNAIRQPLLHALYRPHRISNKPMRRAIINLHYRLIPPHHPLGAHTHRIIEQRILGATREKRRREVQAPYVLVERGDGGVAALLDGGVGQQGGDVGAHHVVVDDEVFLVVSHVGQEEGEVVASEVEEEAAEGEGGGGLQEVEGYEAGEVGACGLRGVSAIGGEALGELPRRR